MKPLLRWSRRRRPWSVGENTRRWMGEDRRTTPRDALPSQVRPQTALPSQVQRAGCDRARKTRVSMDNSQIVIVLVAPSDRYCDVQGFLLLPLALARRVLVEASSPLAPRSKGSPMRRYCS